MASTWPADVQEPAEDGDAPPSTSQRRRQAIRESASQVLLATFQLRVARATMIISKITTAWQLICSRPHDRGNACKSVVSSGLQGVTEGALADALKTAGNFASMFPATQFGGPMGKRLRVHVCETSRPLFSRCTCITQH